MYTRLSRAWSNGFTLIELLVCVVLVLVVGSIIVGGCTAVGGCSQSSGFRVGMIQKASDSGIVWSTHEMEVVTEGIAVAKTSGMTSIWYGTVYDGTLWKSVQDLPAGKKYKFHYKHYIWVMPWHGATKYEIWKIDPV